jgi:hypothetical protein
VNLAEVSVGERVVTLRVVGGFVVDAEVPARVLIEAVLFDELVLLGRRGLMFAPLGDGFVARMRGFGSTRIT